MIGLIHNSRLLLLISYATQNAVNHVNIVGLDHFPQVDELFFLSHPEVRLGNVLATEQSGQSEDPLTLCFRNPLSQLLGVHFSKQLIMLDIL